MAWQNPNLPSELDVLGRSVFSLDNTAPPPQLLNLPQQQVQPLPQYSPPPTQDYVTPINPTERGFHTRLVGLKQNWNDKNDEETYWTNLLNTGKFSDKDNQAMQDRIGLLRFQKDEYARAAEQMRNAARSAGIDTRGFNADNTLAYAQQQLLNNDTRAIQGLLNLKSVADQQHDVYNRAVEMGMSKKNALIVANNMGDRLRQNNADQLIAGFRNYGINDDGSVNSLGMQFIGRLAQEDPVTATLFSQGFAVPKDAYGQANENQRTLARINAELQGNLANREFDWRKHMATLGFSREERLAAQEHAKQMAELNAALKGTGVPQDKLAEEIQNLKRLGLNDQQAAEFYLAKHYGDAIKTLKPDDEILKDEQKFANFVDGTFGSIEHFLQKGNYAQAQTLIDNFRTKLLGEDFKYAEIMNSQRAQYFLERLDLYDKVAKNELSFEEMQAMLNATNNSFRAFKETNYDEKAIQNAKGIQNKQNTKNEPPQIWSPTNSNLPNPFIDNNPFNRPFVDISR